MEALQAQIMWTRLEAAFTAARGHRAEMLARVLPAGSATRQEVASQLLATAPRGYRAARRTRGIRKGRAPSRVQPQYETDGLTVLVLLPAQCL